MKRILLIILFLSFFSLVGICFAQTSLEVDYPSIRGYEITEETVTFGKYIKYIYLFVIAISGFIGLGVLIWAGFKYMTSSGNPERMGDAKDWITRALIGLLIIFLSWIIVNTINPELTVLTTKPTVPFISDLPRGVVLCEKQVDLNGAWQIVQEYKDLDISSDTIDRRKQLKEDFETIMQEVIPNCISRTGAVTGLTRDFRYIYLVPTENRNYGAIAFKKSGFRGELQMFMPVEGDQPVLGRPVEKTINLDDVASVYSFALNTNPDPSWGVTLYSEENFNYALDKPCVEYSIGGGSSSGCDPGNINWIESIGIGAPTSIKDQLEGKSPESLRIEGNLLVILTKDPNAKASDPGTYTVKKESDPSLLNDDPIINWRPSIRNINPEDKGLEPVAAAQKMIIVSYSTDLSD